MKFKDGSVKTLETDGVFVALGAEPETGFIPSEIKKTTRDISLPTIKCKRASRGFLPRATCAKNLRQIVTASSDGAIAGQFAAEYALENFDNR